ncbi:hypothetical protein [Thauera sp.]|uniref:hypothetical protein n=1 Tax=Thauera sp. TaxID=1905334 RepID=UPI002C9C0B6D|nr:hypothetical protein [Thauera sp.]HRP23912.1 hypothetical protein [Thauera sp.]
MSSLIPEMYVLWHPRCEAGEALATRIYGWLRPGNGLGPQVFYRRCRASSARRRLAPRHRRPAVTCRW